MVTLRHIWREGLGESATFYGCHPLLNLSFFLFAIGITMLSNHPVFLLISFVLSWCYSFVLSGKSGLLFNLLCFVPAIVIMTLLNTLNVHNGVTVLCYLNGNRITLEAIVYGLVSSVMLTSSITWFRCFSIVVTAEKFIYLFGRIAPVLALTLSMIMRYIPLLKNRFQEIQAGQQCMGRGLKSDSWWSRLRHLGKEASILIAWSLEASIESGDSMEARGYGLRGRTSFHLYRLKIWEKWLLLLIFLLGACPFVLCTQGATNIYYYPTILWNPMTAIQSLSAMLYATLLSLPLILDLKGAYSWNSFTAKI